MKTLKNLILTGIVGAGLLFGAVDRAKAQCNCQTYNHDKDEFQEEIICWKKEGFNSWDLKPNQNIAGLTIFYYVDKDNDNFYESVKIFNYDDKYSDFITDEIVNIEDFYIEKSTGLISYSAKSCDFNKLMWNERFSKNTPIQIIAGNIFENLPEAWKVCRQQNYNALTKNQLYSLFPGFWTFYAYQGGFGERTKKLISAGKNLNEIKNMVNSERMLWGSRDK